MGRHLNCGGDFGAERRCFGELSKKQDDDMDNLKVGNSRRRRLPKGALMSGFEKPPPPAPNDGKGANA